MAQDRALSRYVPALPECSRRQLLAGTGALLALQAAPSFAANEQPFFHSARRAGLQLFSVLEALAIDRDATFAQIAGLGYSAVETVTTVPGTAAELRAGLDGAGLTCRSGHYFPEPVPGLNGLNFSNDLSRIINDAGVIGLDYAVMAFSPAPTRLGGPATGENLGQFFARITPQLTADDWRWIADSLNRTGAILARSGLRLAYHNHDRELARYGADSALDILLQNTDPAWVSFELDAGWVRRAGSDPVSLLDSFPGRFRLLHIKEIVPVGEAQAATSSAVPLGTDGTDWTAILHAADRAGVEGYFVEHEPPFSRSPLDIAGDSIRYLARVRA